MFDAHYFRSYLQQHANETAAKAMSAYMKNQFRFIGIKSPDRKMLFSTFLKKFPPPNDSTVVYDFVQGCWQMQERELHYCALELLIKKQRLWGPGDLPFFEHLVTNNSWWDTVDSLASNVLGKWFLRYPDSLSPSIESWLNSENLWLQRCCLIFQLKYKEKTDEAILKNTVLALRDSPEFFLRKAIGWALREYSKTNPAFVLSFTEQYHLSALSRREALKHL